MIINRINLTKLTEIFKKVEDVKFNINTQYKLLKMKKSIEEEEQIYIQQLNVLKEFCLKDDDGNFIQDDNGGYKIDDTKKEQCAQLIAEINTLQIQVPDMYFSLEELEPLNLTFKELEALEPFIKI